MRVLKVGLFQEGVRVLSFVVNEAQLESLFSSGFEKISRIVRASRRRPPHISEEMIEKVLEGLGDDAIRPGLVWKKTDLEYSEVYGTLVYLVRVGHVTVLNEEVSGARGVRDGCVYMSTGTYQSGFDPDKSDVFVKLSEHDDGRTVGPVKRKTIEVPVRVTPVSVKPVSVKPVKTRKGHLKEHEVRELKVLFSQAGEMDKKRRCWWINLHAGRLGVPYLTVYNIVTGKAWRHVKPTKKD